MEHFTRTMEVATRNATEENERQQHTIEALRLEIALLTRDKGGDGTTEDDSHLAEESIMRAEMRAESSAAEADEIKKLLAEHRGREVLEKELAVAHEEKTTALERIALLERLLREAREQAFEDEVHVGVAEKIGSLAEQRLSASEAKAGIAMERCAALEQQREVLEKELEAGNRERASALQRVAEMEGLLEVQNLG